jgi:hypothetical protein
MIARNYSQSERFGDEVAHMVGGHFVLKGKKIYQDLQSNHQPLNYFFSAAVEKLAQPTNLYLYISRQRMAVYLYGAFWQVIYLVFFGPAVFLFTLVFEINKYWFSGYKLLGETMAAYPLVFLFGLSTRALMFEKRPSGLALVAFSIASFIAVFSLLPLWAVVAPLNLMMLFYLKKERKLWLYQLIPFTVLTTILFCFVFPPHLVKETVWYNFRYFLPETAVKNPPSLLNILIMPLVALIPPYSPTKLTVALLVALSLITAFICMKEKKLGKWLILIFLFIMCNFFRADDFSYGSFHLLPWFGALAIIETVMIAGFLADSNRQVKKIAQLKTMVLTVLVLWLYLFAGRPYLNKQNLIQENYINYSDSETYGRAVRLLKGDNDRLVAFPNDPLINWVAGADTGTRILEYYNWIFPIPEYQNEIKRVFESNPPEFVVDTGANLKEPTEAYVYKVLKEKYIRLNHLDKPSKLYVLKKKMPQITNNQWEELRLMLFTTSSTPGDQ